MKEKTVCFTGHRALPAEALPRLRTGLKEAVESLIAEGYCRFEAGGALGFDTLAAQTVLSLREKYPHIRLVLILPCLNQTRGWRAADVEEYARIKASADECIYTSESYTKFCMHLRNRRLVEDSSVCVYYLTKEQGGTAYTVKCARAQDLRMVPIQ